MSEEKKTIERSLVGEVVSTKMQESAVVRVDSTKIHSRLNLRYKSSKKYIVHNPKDEYKVGEKVVITACRPMSKHIRFRITGKSQVK